MIATVRRAVLGVLLALLAAPAAHAQDTGTYTSQALEWGLGSAWVDFDGDGRADFCRGVSGGLAGKIACTVATGKGFGATYTSDAIDVGYADGRYWGDVNGDKKADYCRRVGNGGADSQIACSLSTGSGWTEAGHTVQDWGTTDGAALTDATGDGKADFCRITGSDPNSFATCSPGALGTPFSAPVDPGSARAFIDFTGDGKADYCRVTSVMACTVSSGTGWAGTISALPTDLGYAPGRA